MELLSLVTSIETSARAPYLSVYGATDKDPNPRAHSNIPISSGAYPSPTTAEMDMSPVSNGTNGGHSASASPQPEPKNVRFELVSSESPQHRARLPMRVQIYPHDATESIVTTVKNFYGLYSSPTSSKGVSFEDEAGNTMIARYENFRNNMVVYVRVIEEPTASAGSFGAHSYHHPNAVGAQMYFSPDAYGSQAGSHVQHEAHLSRPASRTSRRRSPSPNIGRSARSTSVGTNNSGAPKSRSRSTKYRGDGGESHNGYSSGDGAPGSNSGRNKDQIGNTEISVENIVEGGRRKRAKFESSVRCHICHSGILPNEAFANGFIHLSKGAAFVCPATDAGRNVEPFRISCPPSRAPPRFLALCSPWTEPVYKPSTAPIPPEQWQWVRPPGRLRHTQR